MKSFTVIPFLGMVLFSKCELPNYYEIDYVNNADYDVYIQVLTSKGKYINCYPDTTIFFDKESMGSAIEAHSYVKVNIGTLPIENYFEQLPSDTLSVFYFHSDTLDKYTWEEIQRDYKILQRYDLSIG
ncbi:MAG: hypothetical protein LBS12_06035, partial [Prevotellaceae bacterium]|nr:hypothetical protein [Prevotellaceae bacterium]